MNDPIGVSAPGRETRYRQRNDAEQIARDAYKEVYDAYFRAVPATTEEQRERSFRLRFQVYCLEHAFEPTTENPEGMETDRYDAQSVHSLLLHRSSENAVGTVRLILPRMNGHDAPLPIETICAPASMELYAHRVPSGRTAEISRFAIAKKYRGRKAGNDVRKDAVTTLGGNELRAEIPNICLGLMRAIVAMAREAGMSHLYAVMEPTLLRMLRKLGVYFEPLGPMVDYHGRRQPCFCDLDHLLTTTYRKRPDVWAVMTDSGLIWPLDRWNQVESDALIPLGEKPPSLAGHRAYPATANSNLASRIKGIN